MKKFYVLSSVLFMMSLTCANVEAEEKYPLLSEEAYKVEYDYLNGEVRVKDIFETYSIESIEEYIEKYGDIDNVYPLEQGLKNPERINSISNPYIEKARRLRETREKKEEYAKRTDLKPLKNQALLDLTPLDEDAVYGYEMVYEMEDTISDSIWDEKPGHIRVYHLCKICGNEAYVAWEGDCSGPVCSPSWPGFCETCGYEAHDTFSDEKEALGFAGKHEYLVERIQPTCCADGKVTTICTMCLSEETEVIPKISHEYEKQVTLEPTFFKSGEMREICKYCGKEKSTEVIPSKLKSYTSGLF